MMNEEAIKSLNTLRESINGVFDYNCRNQCTALDMAIKALEQQPCEDCVSRESVIRLVEQYPNIIGNRCSGLISDIKHLPSVIPKYTDEEIDKIQEIEQAYVDKMVELAVEESKRPKGKWIEIQSGDKDFPESIVCSRCKNENSHLDFNEHSEPIGKVFVTSKYCPNCGAEMEVENNVS